MPISLTLSKRGGKEKISNSAISADNSQLGLQLDSSTLSSQESSKDWATGDSTEITKTTAGEASITGPETTDSANPAMKSIIGRSSAKQPLDPDSSSLGPIESAKEAKEKDKNKSWVKTIGMRTLRLRKNTDSSKSKAHSSSSHGIFSSQSQSLNQSSPSHSEGNLNLNSRNSEGGDGASGGGGGGGSTLPAGGLSSLETGTTAAAAATTTGTGSKGIFGKSKKSSSASASNGTAFREMLSSITQPNASPSSIHSSGADPSSAASGKQAGNAGSGSGTGPGQTGSNQETEGSSSDKQDPARFAGDGMSFKAKLIGVLEVSGPRGDRICQEALSELKMAVKAAGEHKQKITVHIALDGLRIRDEKTGDCLYHHQVHKISFIAQDLTDARAFGYIFGSPDMGHRFFGIKTEKSASQVVIAMRDLFQVVFDLKKKEIERAKQQLEMQQKFLATRAAETSTSAPKTDHKSSIAETYIEGACALGSGSLSSPGMSGHASTSASASNAVPEVDLLNLEVELNSLQEGLDNIHNNLADSVPFRGSTASISSDPMNPMSSSNANTNTNTLNTVTHPKFSMHGGNTNCNFTSTSGDPFGDSFDPFDNSGGIVGGFSGQQHHHQIRQNSQITSPSPVTFAAADPFAQIDPFPQPTFSNLESSDSFFNSDPFDTPGGGGGGGNLGSAHSNSNFSFSFGGEERGVPSEPQRHHHTSASSEREARVNLRNNSGSSSAIGNSVINNNSSSSMGFNSSGGASRLQNSNDGFGMGWQASFDDNFVMDMNGENANDPSKAESLDVFTELDPLGTGRVRPFVDRKDFFQDLKNPPRRVLKDLYATEGGSAVQLSSLSSAEEYNQQQQLQQQQSELQAHPHHQQQQQPQLLSAPTTNKVLMSEWMSFDSD